MEGRLTVADKVKIVRLYSVNRSYQETRLSLYREGIEAGKWGKVGVDRSGVPSNRTVYDINKLFDETGCVEKRNLKSQT